MYRWLLIWFLSCPLTWTLFETGVLGQVSSVYGSLRVTIVDPSGARIPNAVVTALLLDRSWNLQALTGPTGDTHFPALVPGDYRVAAHAASFARKEAVIKVLLGHEASLQLVLELEAQPQQVTVRASMLRRN